MKYVQLSLFFSWLIIDSIIYSSSFVAFGVSSIFFAIIDGRVEVIRHVQPFLFVVIDHVIPRQVDDRLPSTFAWEISIPAVKI